MSKISLSDDLITITQKLMMARERSEVMNVASDCTALIERLIALENQGSIAAYQKTRSVTTIMKFTHKEIQLLSLLYKQALAVKASSLFFSLQSCSPSTPPVF